MWENGPMKAFLGGVIVMLAVSIGAFYALQGLDWSSANVYRSENVRL